MRTIALNAAKRRKKRLGDTRRTPGESGAAKGEEAEEVRQK